ncbi:MAG: hypothetical protein GW903_02470 [Alphaproteobacteria bacterium]|nr:hypothetical protein [Alphaproteobacteria bacterium]NCQ87837.1 hypothetical protein [Alphaproteobacteria bacterium]NCT05655.1 hypothetical protein [Alphaproteobacteria bacterium]
MIIVCPECSSRYMLSATAIGETGRTVRCANCGHQWHQEPQRIVSKPALKTPDIFDTKRAKPKNNFDDDAPDFDDFADQDDLDVPDIGYGFEQDEPRQNKGRTPSDSQPEEKDDFKRYVPEQDIPDSVKPLPEGSNVPAFRATTDDKSKNKGAKIAAVLLALILFGVFAGYSVLFKSRVLAVFPQAAALYIMAGIDVPIMGDGLIIEKASAIVQTVKDQEVLVIKGNVLNLKETRLKVPQIIVTLRDEAGNNGEIFMIEPRVTLVNPGGTFDFTAEFKNPPAGAVSANLTFEMKFDL